MTADRAIANLMIVHRDFSHFIDNKEQWDLTIATAIRALEYYKENKEPDNEESN